MNGLSMNGPSSNRPPSCKLRPMQDSLTIAADLLPYASQSCVVGEHSMAYLDEGDREAGRPTLLCVHGNPTWSFYYRRVVDAFAADHRVVAVDHIGCGRSDKPCRDRFGYRLADHRDNLITLVEHLDLQRIVLVAHDWGGAIGLSAMHALRSRLAGIVLLNTAAFPPPYMPRRIAACRWPVVGTPAVRGLNLFAKAAVTMAMARTKMTDATRRGLLAPYDTWQNRVAIDAFVRDIPLDQSHPTMATLEELELGLPDFADVPIELIWGMKDWCFREECLLRFESVWPHAVSHRLAQTGHYVMEDSPDQTLAILDAFVRRLDA